MMVCRRGNREKSGPWARRGSLLAEVAMSGAMLMIAMALTVKVLGWVGVERKVWDRRQWAAQEAANLMEQITSRAFGDVTAETAKKLSLSPEARRLLPDAGAQGCDRRERSSRRSGVEADRTRASLAQPLG